MHLPQLRVFAYSVMQGILRIQGSYWVSVIETAACDNAEDAGLELYRLILGIEAPWFCGHGGTEAGGR